jgi:hypothetical protein
LLSSTASGEAGDPREDRDEAGLLPADTLLRPFRVEGAFHSAPSAHRGNSVRVTCCVADKGTKEVDKISLNEKCSKTPENRFRPVLSSEYWLSSNKGTFSLIGIERIQRYQALKASSGFQGLSIFERIF